MMCAVLDRKTGPVSRNGGFDTDQGGWTLVNGAWDSAGGHTGGGALRFAGPDGASCEQKVSLPGGEVTVTCLGFVKLTGSGESSGTVELMISTLDGEHDTSSWSPLSGWHLIPVTPQPGVWTPVAITADIAELSGRTDVGSLLIRLSARDFGDGCELLVDDLGLYMHE